MTDKLADALKVCVEQLERTHHLIKGPDNSGAINTGREALTEYKAAKAATPDDVREAMRSIDEAEELLGDLQVTIDDLKDRNGVTARVAVNTLYNAALRQGGPRSSDHLTLPREVVDYLTVTSKESREKYNKQHPDSQSAHYHEGRFEVCDEALALLDQHARGG